MKQAIVANGKVAGVIEKPVDPKWKPPYGELVDVDDTVGTDDLYDGVSFSKASPQDAEPVTVVSKLGLLRLFTPEEVIKWNAAKADLAVFTSNDYADPTSPMAVFSYFMQLYDAASTFDLKRADTKQGLDALVAIGVITKERKFVIANGGVAPKVIASAPPRVG